MLHDKWAEQLVSLFICRRYALITWKDKAVYPTYHRLLCICIAGEWMDSAKIIVKLLNTW